MVITGLTIQKNSLFVFSICMIIFLLEIVCANPLPQLGSSSGSGSEEWNFHNRGIFSNFRNYGLAVSVDIVGKKLVFRRITSYDFPVKTNFSECDVMFRGHSIQPI